VERYNDFDRAFLPVKDNLGRRWSSIARAYHDGVNLPPVHLYKVGDAYFVVDGHHRISVARQQRVKYVDAVVIEIESKVPLTADTDENDLEIKDGYVRFLEHTHLDRLRPEQNVELTIDGGYRRLSEHIAVHRYFMELEQEREIARDKAICDWYDRLYLPLVQFIRQSGILSHLPGRTEADLYLWIMEHQHYLQEQCGPTVSQTGAAEHFAQRYTARPIQRALNIVQELVNRLDCARLAKDKETATEREPS
jgi:hypothetical protein